VRQSKVTPQRPTANPPTKPKDYITVDVVQGLGDIFWIYQKLAPFYQTINFNICCVTLDNVQRRALPWMSLLPKVKEVTMKLVKGPVYAQMATTKYNLAEVMQAWNAGKTPPPYAVNKWLEEGVRIDEIDQSPVEKNVALKSEHFDVPFEKFMTLYVSGNAKKKGLPSWSIQQWLEYIDLFYVRYNPDLPIVVIGADFDKEAIDDISLGLVERKIDTI
jgi:hypothetical protein